MPRSENPKQDIHGCVRAARRVVAAISTPPHIRTPVGIAAGTCAITTTPNSSTISLHNDAPIATVTGTCATITTPNPSTTAAYIPAPIPTPAICTAASRKVCVIIVVDDGDIVVAFGDLVSYELLELHDLSRRDHLDVLAPLVDVDLNVD